MGGGTTIVEALRLGCRVVGIDLNPVASFAVRKEVEHVDIQLLESLFRSLEEKVANALRGCYQTRCPRGHDADIMYAFWIKLIPCVACGNEVPIFHSFRLASKGGFHTVVCPHCYAIVNGDFISRRKVF